MVDRFTGMLDCVDVGFLPDRTLDELHTLTGLHILPVLGSTYVDQVRSEPIAALVQKMREKEYATGTTNRVELAQLARRVATSATD